LVRAGSFFQKPPSPTLHNWLNLQRSFRAFRIFQNDLFLEKSQCGEDFLIFGSTPVDLLDVFPGLHCSETEEWGTLGFFGHNPPLQAAQPAWDSGSLPTCLHRHQR
jgi:hypothetical protein